MPTQWQGMREHAKVQRMALKEISLIFLQNSASLQSDLKNYRLEATSNVLVKLQLLISHLFIASTTFCPEL